MIFFLTGLLALLLFLWTGSELLKPIGWQHLCQGCNKNLSGDNLSYVFPHMPPASIEDGDIHTYLCTDCQGLSLYIGGRLCMHEAKSG